MLARAHNPCLSACQPCKYTGAKTHNNLLGCKNTHYDGLLQYGEQYRYVEQVRVRILYGTHM